MIKLTDKEGNEFILEYTRETVATMEKMGFEVGKFTEKPMLMLPLAFKGAFLKNHKGIKQNKIDSLFNGIKNKSQLIDVLADMLVDTYQTLSDKDETSEGNVEMEIL